MTRKPWWKTWLAPYFLLETALSITSLTIWFGDTSDPKHDSTKLIFWGLVALNWATLYVDRKTRPKDEERDEPKP